AAARAARRRSAAGRSRPRPRALRPPRAPPGRAAAATARRSPPAPARAEPATAPAMPPSLRLRPVRPQPPLEPHPLTQGDAPAVRPVVAARDLALRHHRAVNQRPVARRGLDGEALGAAQPATPDDATQRPTLA